MVKKKSKFIFLGILFILVALGFAVAAFYFFEVKPELAARYDAQLKELGAKITRVDQRAGKTQKTADSTTSPTSQSKSEPSLFQKVKKSLKESLPTNSTSTQKPIPPSKTVQKSPAVVEDKVINLQSLVKQAELVYGNGEKQRKEGLLWIDHKSSKIVATLGAVQGILPGHTLTVYDGQKKISQVTVETAFDVISYVRPQNNSPAFTQGNYYRVVVE